MNSEQLTMSVTAMDRIVPAQVRAGRALLDWSRPQAATRCRVDVSTLKRLETGSRMPSAKTMSDIVAAFNEHGVQFIDQDGHAGVLLMARPTSTLPL